MKFLSKNYVSNESDAGGYALITIDEATVKVILERKELFQMVKSKDSDLESMGFWGTEAEFFDCYAGQYIEESLGEAKNTELEEGNLVRVSEDFAIPDNRRTRTDCDRMIIREDGITWSAVDFYGSGDFDTCELSFDELLTPVVAERVAPAVR